MREGSSGRARRRSRRLLGTALAVLALVAGGAFLLEVLNRERALRDAFPTVDGSLALPGLERPVRVLRDARGIPHVEARSERDAYRALGFSQAQDRLAQMLWLVRSARGRLAEVLGSEALAADRQARLLGIARHAERAAEALPADTQALLVAYSEGVNAFLEHIRSGRAAPPIAVRTLEIPLEPWTPADSAAVLKLYAWALAGTTDAGLVLQDLIERLGGFGARPFFPPGVGLEALPESSEAAWRGPWIPETGPGNPLRSASGLVGRSLGSSAFAIGGRHTRSGLPILAADSHLPARAPGLLYQTHLRWPGGGVAGATIPGIPLFWSGHNGRVAWAAVHAGAVVADLYVETLNGEGGRYHDGAAWRDFSERTEEIAVRGDAPRQLLVRDTRHGTVVNEIVDGPREPLTLAWSGARRGDPFTAFLGVVRARSAAQLRAALESHHEPVVTVVYADREGAVGRQLAGWIPRRSLPTGLVPVPGRNRWYRWKEPVPFEFLSHAALEEGRGFVVAADARLTRDGDPVVIEWLWRSGARAKRIRELLRKAIRTGDLELRGAMELQRDVYSPSYRAVVDGALGLAGPLEDLGTEERWVAEALRSWDGHSAPGSLGATVYDVFLHQLLDAMLAPVIGRDMLGRYLAIPHVDAVHLLRRLLAAEQGGREPGELLQPRATAKAVQRSLRDTWIWLSVKLGPNQDRWSWGRVHRLTFRPLWQEPGWERRWLGPFPAAGDGATVAAAEYDPTDPFEVRVASTYRFALDLAAPGEALTSLAPGQSGHPGHPQSVDGVGRWLEGRPRLLATSPLLVEEMAVARLELEPAP